MAQNVNEVLAIVLILFNNKVMINFTLIRFILVNFEYIIYSVKYGNIELN